MDQILFWLVPAASIMALCFAWYFHRQMMKESEGTPQMIKIAAAVRKGAMSYLRQQYKIVGWVFLGLVILFSIMAYGFGVQNSWVPIAFLTGGFFSGLSGFLGMKTATYACKQCLRGSAHTESQHGSGNDAEFMGGSHYIFRNYSIQQQIPERYIKQAKANHYQSHHRTATESHA